MRIASLLPSATEIVCALGARDELVGVSHECDHPDGLEGLPILTRVRAALPDTSGAIDVAVRRLIEDTLAVYDVEVEALERAAPDVIVTQSLCDVCAVSPGDVERALREIVSEEARMVALAPVRLPDVWEDVRTVGRAVGREAEGDRVASELERRIAALTARTGALGTRPRVLTIEWLDPVMVGGTWMPELVRAAGGEALVTEPGEHAPTLDVAALAALDPDVVLFKPCGFDLERTEREASLVRDLLAATNWRAGREGRAFVADGNAYFNRPGPRLVQSAEILAACLHPDACADLASRHASSLRRVTPEGAWAAISAGT